jgi:transcriptional regulator with XRE-family HTH domain
MAREELNLVGLGELVGVSHVTIHKWMHGLSTPRDSNVHKLAGALRVDPIDVYRAITGAMHNSREWPEDVHAVIEDYLALSPHKRRAFRGMVRYARELEAADEDKTAPPEEGPGGR